MSKPTEQEIFEAQLLHGVPTEQHSEAIQHAFEKMNEALHGDGNSPFKGMAELQRARPFPNHLLPERPIGPVCPMEIYRDTNGMLAKRLYFNNPFTGQSLWHDYPAAHEAPDSE